MTNLKFGGQYSRSLYSELHILTFQLGRHFLVCVLKPPKQLIELKAKTHSMDATTNHSDREKIRAGGTGSNLKVFV
ncbi:hypothetical protein [uncultured Nostoc sp.]|uniref:hypothetical protein n=1 Tax=uncultured Nostoc sp. TaxID=340711 RepID=UPI0035CC02A6